MSSAAAARVPLTGFHKSQRPLWTPLSTIRLLLSVAVDVCMWWHYFPEEKNDYLSRAFALFLVYLDLRYAFVGALLPRIAPVGLLCFFFEHLEFFSALADRVDNDDEPLSPAPAAAAGGWGGEGAVAQWDAVQPTATRKTTNHDDYYEEDAPPSPKARPGEMLGFDVDNVVGDEVIELQSMQVGDASSRPGVRRRM